MPYSMIVTQGANRIPATLVGEFEVGEFIRDDNIPCPAWKTSKVAN